MPAVSPGLDSRERSCVEQVLNSATLAYVAVLEPPGHNARPDPRPYVTPMNFVYQPAMTDSPNGNDAGATERTSLEGRLLLHTGPGRKVDALAVSPYVCVSVTAQEELQLGDTPCQDGYLYQSVILEGRASLLTEETEREAALRAIVAKYDPDAVDKPFDPRIFAQTLLYVVHIDVIGFKERPKQVQQP